MDKVVMQANWVTPYSNLLLRIQNTEDCQKITLQWAIGWTIRLVDHEISVKSYEIHNNFYPRKEVTLHNNYIITRHTTVFWAAHNLYWPLLLFPSFYKPVYNLHCHQKYTQNLLLQLVITVYFNWLNTVVTMNNHVVGIT